MEVSEGTVESIACCSKCETPLKGDERFCGNCGSEIGSLLPEAAYQTPDALTPAMLYYFVTLVLLATYKFTPIFPEGLHGSIVISALDAAVVIGFWIYLWRTVESIFSLRGIRVGIVAAIIGGTLVAAALVSLVADYINLTVLEDVYYSPYLFEDTANPFLWTVILTCVFPAVMEEVAFRGFLFENIKALTSEKGALYVTSFLFGILHLSAISLLWLIPLGLAFGWLRMRFNTLWYSIIAHFAYNFFISIIEYYSFQQ